MSDLVTLTIDGTELSVPKGTRVADAAKSIGNDIPVFCHHPKLEPIGACRMCLVEIGMPMRDRATGDLMLEEDGSPKINFGRGLQTSCTAVVGEGMVVRTDTEPVIEVRETLLEFQLVNHPLDCPVCDKGGECPLQNLTMDHGKMESRVYFEDKRHSDKNVPLGDLIFLDRERCIQCARCIRFQDEVVDDPVLQFHDRGVNLEIVTMSDPGFDSYWSGNTTDICPVGALTTADFRFGARPWEMTPAATICSQCPIGCNMTVSTRREAKSGGKPVIKRVLPRQNEAVNELWLCDKGRFTHDYVASSERLTSPMMRKDGELVAVSWDEALTAAAERLQAATSVAGLAGQRLSNEDYFMLQKLFRKGLKSDNLDLNNRQIGGGEVVAQVGVASGSDLQQLGKGDAILVVASDLHEEAPLWWLRVKQATDRGAKLVVINGRFTRLSSYATHNLEVASGDIVSTVRQLVSMAKVETNGETELDAAAETLVGANNLVAFYGYEGLSYEETESLAKALANLLLIQTDGEPHVGRVNNGLIPVWPYANTQGAWDMGIHPAFLPSYKAAKTAGLDAAAMFAGAADGSLNGMFIVGADPIGDGWMADRGKLDLLIVQELFMTETAVSADIIFPAQSWAERDGTFTNGERRVQRYYPAIHPVGDSRPDWQILSQLGERVGADKAETVASLVFKKLSRAARQYKGMDYRSLGQVEAQWPVVGGEDRYYGGNAFANTAGLGKQWAAVAESKAVKQFEMDEVVSSREDGLLLINAASLYTAGTLINKSAVLAPRMAKATLTINPVDAGGYVDGDTLMVRTDRMTVQAIAVVSDDVMAGTAVLRGVKTVNGTVVARLSKIKE